MKSMTAFARVQSQTDWADFSWEIRSVNQRFLDLHFKLPDAYRHLEVAIRERLKSSLHRGKVEVFLRVNRQDQLEDIRVNPERLQSLSAAINQVQQQHPEATHLNPLEVLQWPGVLDTASINETELQQHDSQLLASFEQAIEQLNEGRLREGQALQKILLSKTQKIEELVESVQTQLPNILARHSEKLKQRIEQLNTDLDEQRLHQEVAILAQKIDVEEELDRLTTHVQEIHHLVKQSGPLGRKLDFLMQELNREANTLGSKSTDNSTSQACVELKILIEQMREQVQNIE